MLLLVTLLWLWLPLLRMLLRHVTNLLPRARLPPLRGDVVIRELPTAARRVRRCVYVMSSPLARRRRLVVHWPTSGSAHEIVSKPSGAAACLRARARRCLHEVVGAAGPRRRRSESADEFVAIRGPIRRATVSSTAKRLAT